MSTGGAEDVGVGISAAKYHLAVACALVNWRYFAAEIPRTRTPDLGFLFLPYVARQGRASDKAADIWAWSPRSVVTAVRVTRVTRS